MDNIQIIGMPRGYVLLDVMEYKIYRTIYIVDFPGGSDGKESACNAGDLGLIPGQEDSPGEENGNPLQYSCLENSWTEDSGRLQSMGSQRVRLCSSLIFSKNRPLFSLSPQQ